MEGVGVLGGPAFLGQNTNVFTCFCTCSHLFNQCFCLFPHHSPTLNRAVLTAILPVLSVAAMVILTGSSSSSIGVPPESENDTPLSAVMTRVPVAVGTVVSDDSTTGVPTVNAASAAHVAVADTIVSALVSIGPKSA